LQQTNLLIEARNATLDVEIKTFLFQTFDKTVRNGRKYFRNQRTLQETRISTEFQTTRSVETQSDAENRHRINVFIVTVDSVISGFTRRFESLREISNFFEILWTFEKLTGEEIKASAQKLQQKYAKEISNEICGKLIFMKKIYRTNFNVEPTAANLLQNILDTNLTELFPNVCVALRIFFNSTRFSCFCGKNFQCYEESEEFQPIYNVRRRDK
jgi:hypothetical protein